MILTGKCKEGFEKWLIGNPYDYDEPILYQEMPDFYNLPKSFQYGVFVDFFDTKGILISVAGLTLSKTYIFEIGIDKNVEYFGDCFKSLSEARTAVIKKANLLYNK